VEELRLATDRAGALEQWTEEFRLAAEGKLRESLSALEAREVALGRRHELLRQEVLLQKRRLELILREIRQKTEIDAEVAGQLREEEAHLRDHLEFLHCEAFRGTEEELRERVEAYVPIFAARWEKLGGNAAVLDVGCGRGMLLRVLRDAGIPSRGVDLNEEVVHECQQAGLEVTQGDGLKALAAVPDESLLGVAALHVVEHLSLAELEEFIKLCYQKIIRGGVLVAETPNPANLLAGARDFYADLTHRRPIHAIALSHLIEALGFTGVEVRYLHPAEPELHLRFASGATADLRAENENWSRLDELLFGPRDYAIIASR
jgi:O-antigen chain-terminating methyltransferase